MLALLTDPVTHALNYVEIKMAEISLFGATEKFDSDNVAQVLLQGDEIGNEILIIILKRGGPVSAPASTSNIGIMLTAGFRIYQYNTTNKESSIEVDEVKASLKFHKKAKAKLGS